MDRAARVEGFETDAKGGMKRPRCDLGAVADPDVLANAGLTTDTDPGEDSQAHTIPEVDGDETDGNSPKRT